MVHPAPGNWTGTLVNALIHHCGDSLKGIGGVRRPGIVHRLDKDTSGIMVVAKTEQAHAGLAAQFADHGRSGPLERAYLALVWGAPARNTGTIDAPLGRSPNNRLRRAVVREDAQDAREAITHYTVLRHLDGVGDGQANASLMECRLETGRTHQIRVHMAHIGHPLIGDREYGAHFNTKANVLAEPAQSAVKAFPAAGAACIRAGLCPPGNGQDPALRSAHPARHRRADRSFRRSALSCISALKIFHETTCRLPILCRMSSWVFLPDGWLAEGGSQNILLRRVL